MKLSVDMVLQHKPNRSRVRELHGATVKVVSFDEDYCTWVVVTAPNGDNYWRPGREHRETITNVDRYFDFVRNGVESLFARPVKAKN